MAALVAVMIMVSFATFDWHSIAPGHPAADAAQRDHVMAATVVVTVVTHNLAVGVIVGVPDRDGAVRPPGRAHGDRVERRRRPRRRYALYLVSGELFFASSNDLVYQFDYARGSSDVVIDLTGAHIWDASTVAALDAITTKYRAKGKCAEIVGLNQDSAERHDRLSGQFGADH